MIPYIILLITIYLFSKFENKISTTICSTSILLIGCFREINVGTDTSNYEFFFNNPQYFLRTKDFIWVKIIDLLHHFNLDYRYLIILSNLIIVSMVILSAKKMTGRINLTLFYFIALYFFFQSFNITRQIIAATIILYSFSYIKERNLVKFLLLIIVAMGFHTSTVFVIPFYFFANKSFNTRIIVLVFGISYIVGGLYNFVSILNNSILDFGIYQNLLSDNINMKLGYSLSRLLLNFFISYLMLQNKNSTTEQNLLAVGVILLNLFAPFGYIARFAYYFTIIQIIYFPNLRNEKNKLNYHLSLIYSIIVFFFLLINNNGEVVPYSSILF